MDCGVTTNTGLADVGIERDEIDVILISHFHGDHFGGIPLFLLAALYEDERKRPLEIVGPPEIEARVRTLASAMGHGLESHSQSFPLSFHEVAPNTPRAVGPTEIRSFETRHQLEAHPHGYDIRCADEFKIFTNVHSTVVDPKNFDEKSFVDFKGEVCIIPPNSFALARTMEYFRIPRNVLTICLGKSTYARCGIIVNVTPFEPEWEGYVTLEFSNTTPLPAKIYAGEGCAQVLFFESDEVCETSYKDRGGKYQGQHGVTLPKT